MKLNYLRYYYLIRDFFKYIKGTEYFHLPEKKGDFILNDLYYYVEMRGKYFWKGNFEEAVPVLYYPEANKSYLFPGMILQYGLGALEILCDLEKDRINNRYKSQIISLSYSPKKSIKNVYMWLQKTITSHGYALNNHFKEIDPSIPYVNNYSAMTQGLAISFLTRASESGVLSFNEKKKIKRIIPKLLDPMFINLYEGGCSYIPQNYSLLEYCRSDYNVVLNGWIFAIFGIYDYRKFSKDNKMVDQLYIKTLSELNFQLDKFVSSSGWSFYDNHKRLSSPIYHDLHIIQLEVLYELTGNKDYLKNLYKFKKANTKIKRLIFLAKKIIEKLFDKQSYASEK